jgi:hypothetical protein
VTPPSRGALMASEVCGKLPQTRGRRECRARRQSVHRIPLLTSVTIAIRPSDRGGTAPRMSVIWGSQPSEIFFARRLDSPNQIDASHEFGFFAHAIFALKSWSSDDTLHKNHPGSRSTWPKIGALAKCRGGCMPQEKNPPLATGPKFREDSDLKLIRERAVCCKSHTQRNSASRIRTGVRTETQFYFVKLNDRANQSAARPGRASPRLTRILRRRPSWRGDGC